jgi:hypothetical protein
MVELLRIKKTRVFSQPDVFGLGEDGDFHHKC